MEKETKEMEKPKTTLVLTYNEVYRYRPGIYAGLDGNKVIVKNYNYCMFSEENIKRYMEYMHYMSISADF